MNPITASKNDPVHMAGAATDQDHANSTRPVNFIRFHGLTLLVVENNGMEYIDPRPLCELAGMQWKGARRNLQEGDNVVLYGSKLLQKPVFESAGASGCPEKDVLFILLDRSRLFMARINTNNMRARGNESGAVTLLALQIEWAEALHAYETNGVAVKRGRRDDLGDLGLLYKLRGMAETPEERASLSRQIADQHSNMGYPLIADREQMQLFVRGAA